MTNDDDDDVIKNIFNSEPQYHGIAGKRHCSSKSMLIDKCLICKVQEGGVHEQVVGFSSKILMIGSMYPVCLG